MTWRGEQPEVMVRDSTNNICGKWDEGSQVDLKELGIRLRSRTPKGLVSRSLAVSSAGEDRNKRCVRVCA